MDTLYEQNHDVTVIIIIDNNLTESKLLPLICTVSGVVNFCSS